MKWWSQNFLIIAALAPHIGFSSDEPYLVIITRRQRMNMVNLTHRSVVDKYSGNPKVLAYLIR